MTDTTPNAVPPKSVTTASSERVAATLAKRHAAEKRFRMYGIGAIGLALTFLVILFGSIITQGYSAFWQTEIRLDVHIDEGEFASREYADIRKASFNKMLRNSLREVFPDVKSRKDKKELYKVISSGAKYELQSMVVENPDLIGTTVSFWMAASDDVDMLNKGYIDRNLPESDRRLSDFSIGLVDTLIEKGDLKSAFNTRFFSNADSREPEQAGIWGAAIGSFWTLMVTLLLSFPIGVAAAIYLEEFAPKNKWTDLIEVNINNLAAVPSIVFGLLGLALFLNWFNLPRSAPIVGGMVLTLMTLPTIIIASRAALKAVPPSIREAALGMGASRLQVVTHHVLPLAMPGMLTGTIIGMAQALGETAPLLMIGMVAFIADIPGGPTDPATALPVQIYLWADSPERAFVERTSAAIMVLLGFLIFMNLAAVLLRKKFERRW
ncbi:phosphate ABC transporter permease PstA [Curvivirga sp.]|uniref:phosphate ABC transporter permease PstA n=1 Tax=Curvivirga sp. TaxID=2856848 RepID=UPI003B5A7424